MDKQEIEKKLEEISLLIQSFGEKKPNRIERENILARIDNLAAQEPSNIKVLELKAIFYQYMEEDDNAIAVYNQILEIDPKNDFAKEIIQILKKHHVFYTNNEKSPDLLEKVPCELIFILKIIILFIIICISCPSLVFSWK